MNNAWTRLRAPGVLPRGIRYSLDTTLDRIPGQMDTERILNWVDRGWMSGLVGYRLGGGSAGGWSTSPRRRADGTRAGAWGGGGRRLESQARAGRVRPAARRLLPPDPARSGPLDHNLDEVRVVRRGRKPFHINDLRVLGALGSDLGPRKARMRVLVLLRGELAQQLAHQLDRT
jgi:hypothetical protein